MKKALSLHGYLLKQLGTLQQSAEIWNDKYIPRAREAGSVILSAEGITGAVVNKHGIYQKNPNPLCDNTKYAMIQSPQ